MQKTPLPWLLAAAGVAIGAAALLKRPLGPQRALRATAKDRHIMIIVGKEEGGIFVCGSQVLPDPAPVNKGKNVIWHVANQCDETVTVKLTDFRNEEGQNPFRFLPPALTLGPQYFYYTAGLLKGSARAGRYHYKVLINGVEVDPELIMN